MGGGIVIPYPDGGVSGARSDNAAGRVDGNVIDWAFVTNEFIGSGVGFERCGENDAVVGS